MSETLQDSPGSADAERGQKDDRIKTFLNIAFELASDITKTPGDVAKSGLKYVLGRKPGVVEYFEQHRVDQEYQDTDEQIAEKLDTFTQFLKTENSSYQDVFTLGTKVLSGFTDQVREIHKIDIVVPEKKGHASIPMLNGHRLEAHMQNDGVEVVLHGWTEKIS